MSKRKWGESFLKSGLPLEHLTLMTFEQQGWQCSLHLEYMRRNREGIAAWFELDMVAYSPMDEKDDLCFLVECKYHDTSKFWFFLPCTTVSHMAQYGAMSAGANLETDQYVFNYAPYQALADPSRISTLNLAPRSVWGVAVSEDGVKQENSIHRALQQLAYGYVPYCLDNFYSLTRNWPVSLVPMIVTNAKIYRLKPEILDLEKVRQATQPDEIADEIDWTWCYFAPQNDLLDYNLSLINAHNEEYMLEQYPEINEQILRLWTSPNWVTVVNIDSLPRAITSIHQHFLGLPKNYEYSDTLYRIIKKGRTKHVNNN
jgi:hypothetical protein